MDDETGTLPAAERRGSGIEGHRESEHDGRRCAVCQRRRTRGDELAVSQGGERAA